MRSSIQVTVTLGANEETDLLHAYLTKPVFIHDQHLTMVSGSRIADYEDEDTHEGSKQGGLLSVYVGNLHDVAWHDVENYLYNAPWDGVEAAMVVHQEHDRAYLDRLGFDPVRSS